MSSRSPSDNLLHALHGGGQLEPGSKMMQIGLDHHNPLQALEELVANEEMMSVALHEITHFDSLENSLGHLLGFLGFMVSASAQTIHQQLQDGTPIEADQLRNFLFVRQQYSSCLNMWRPLLEGLALYVQTSRPCQESDDLVSALNILNHVGTELTVLDPPSELFTGMPGDNATIDLISRGVLSTGYASMLKGPCLGGETLAAELEFNTEPEWLPYFLGHAYVRALNHRLIRISPDFECPEIFMKTMLRVLNASTRRLLKTEALSELEPIDRIYNWIELFEHAPADRMRELQNLKGDVDVLWFLETGERLAGWEEGPQFLARTLSQLVPEAWRMFTGVFTKSSFEGIAAKVGDELSANFAEEAPARVINGIIAGTGSLNFSSNGDCSICGWVQNGLGERHALAIRVEQSTWWMVLTNDEMAALPYTVDRIPQLPSESIRPSAGIQPDITDLLLKINCFVTRTRYGFPADKKFAGDLRYPACLFEFTHPETSGWSLVAIVTSGDQRGVLEPAPKATTQGLHTVSEQMRAGILDFSSIGLENWARAFDQKEYSDLATLTRSISENEQLMLFQQRELWARRILIGLLGSGIPNKTKRRLMNERMNAVFTVRPELRSLLGASYSGASVIASGNDDWMTVLALINKDAIARVGKPVFDINYETNSVRYLGLWTSPN